MNTKDSCTSRIGGMVTEVLNSLREFARSFAICCHHGYGYLLLVAREIYFSSRVNDLLSRDKSKISYKKKQWRPPSKKKKERKKKPK
jgi:hypothetical protein